MIYVQNVTQKKGITLKMMRIIIPNILIAIKNQKDIIY